MDNRKEISGEAVSRLVFQALLELELSDEAVRNAEKEVSRLGDEIRNDPALNEAGRQKLLTYIRQVTLLTDKQYHHLYSQGAKDCVALLRELGVIK